VANIYFTYWTVEAKKSCCYSSAAWWKERSSFCSEQVFLFGQLLL